MVDVEYERDRAEILLNRAFVVLQQLDEYWQSYHEGMVMLSGYSDASERTEDDNLACRLIYKDKDMEVVMYAAEYDGVEINMHVEDYGDLKAGVSYVLDPDLSTPVTYEAFWELYKMIKGM